MLTVDWRCNWFYFEDWIIYLAISDCCFGALYQSTKSFYIMNNSCGWLFSIKFAHFVDYDLKYIFWHIAQSHFEYRAISFRLPRNLILSFLQSSFVDFSAERSVFIAVKKSIFSTIDDFCFTHQYFSPRVWDIRNRRSYFVLVHPATLLSRLKDTTHVLVLWKIRNRRH